METDWIGRAETLTIQVRDFVSGRWSEGGGKPLEKYSPRDGRILTRFRAGELGDIERAVITTRRAFHSGVWANEPVQRRKDVLYRLAALLEDNREEFALLESLDAGKPISDALNFDVPKAAAVIRFSAEAADKINGNIYAADGSSLSYQLRRPVGVVAGIVGWNFPLLLAAGKIGPALVTGNCLILKPSELTPLSTGRLAELAIQAGVPEGVFNVIHGGAEVGNALARHHDVDLVSFTGSTQTGKQLLVASGQSNMKRLILECGGKAPNIVFDDSPNLDAVADAVVARAFWNQGQVCTASTRLLIQRSIKDELLATIIQRAAAWRVGDPLLAETRLGAVVSEQHKSKILAYIERGIRDGARIVYHPECAPPHSGGCYVTPVIFDNVKPTEVLAQEEIFGPVLSVIEFRDEEEAIKIANETIYGLSAIAWTKNLARAHRIGHGVHAGWVVVNATDHPKGGPSVGSLTVGGHKQSGLGTEGGLEGLEGYTTSTAVQYFV
jgi:acyl-CoA reductase-like NAD-dependent aldehyde dehydrogenase